MDKPRRVEKGKRKQTPKRKGPAGRYRTWAWAGVALLALALVGVTLAVGAIGLGPKIGPRASFKQETFDFGKVPYGQVVQAVYEFRNTGDAPLKVEDVRVETVEGC